jgi:hypothetical protein
MKSLSAFAIILAFSSTVARGASECVLPKPLKDEVGHSDPAIWGPAVRVKANAIDVRNEATPNAGIVSIRLNNKTVFFDGRLRKSASPELTPRYTYGYGWKAAPSVLRGILQLHSSLRRGTPNLTKLNRTVATATSWTSLRKLYESFARCSLPRKSKSVAIANSR